MVSSVTSAPNIIAPILALNSVYSKIVEKVSGKKWQELYDKQGYPGRDMALYLARRRSGLTLKAIGAKVGKMDYKAVGKAVERFGYRLKMNSLLAAQTNRCLREMSFVETRP